MIGVGRNSGVLLSLQGAVPSCTSHGVGGSQVIVPLEVGRRLGAGVGGGVRNLALGLSTGGRLWERDRGRGVEQVS